MTEWIRNRFKPTSMIIMIMTIYMVNASKNLQELLTKVNPATLEIGALQKNHSKNEKTLQGQIKDTIMVTHEKFQQSSSALSFLIKNKSSMSLDSDNIIQNQYLVSNHMNPLDKQKKRQSSKQTKRDHVKSKNKSNKGRRRRHNRKHKLNRQRGIRRKSCPTFATYSVKTEAEDMFGNKVFVYPSIHIGNLAIDQYFYESFCDVENCRCAGIDSKNFISSCETNYSYTYARVVQEGKIGWTHIKVRSGCSCIVHERYSRGPVNIMDLISS